MRLLQIMASNKRGGAELFFARLSLAMQSVGIEQCAVLRQGADCRAELHEHGVPTVTLPFWWSGEPLTKWLLGRQIAEFSPDIVLSWMSRAAGCCPPGPFVNVARLGGYYNLKYYRHCDHLIGNTPDIVRYLIESGWPAARAHYLPNFVDESPANAKVDRASLGTPDNVPLLLALGRLHDDKAFDVLLDALAMVPDAYLWLAGEGPLYAKLLAQSQALGLAERVRFLGWRDDAGALLEASDILVCPSRIEPLGNVILEGWAKRRPVVAGSSKGPVGLIDHGRNGLLAPLENAAALADALNAVISDAGLAESLASGGYQAYMTQFSRQAVVDRYLQFFARIAH